MKNTNWKKNFIHIFGNIVFWGYNLLGLLFISTTVVPGFAIFSSMNNALPWNVAICIYILILLPIAALVIGFSKKIRPYPDKLLKIFFGAELPIIVLVLARLVVIREMTGVMWFFFLSVIVCIVGFMLNVFNTKFQSKVSKTIILLSQEVALILAGYAALLFFFVLPIVGAAIFEGLSHFDFAALWGVIVYSKGLVIVQMVFFLLLFFATVGLFIISPFVASFTYWKIFKEIRVEVVKKYGKLYSRLMTYGFCALYIIAVIALSYQGYKIPTDRLEALKSAVSFEEQQKQAKELLKDENILKDTLTNEYLSSYRYFTDLDNSFLSEPYNYFYQTNPETSKMIQDVFNTLAMPFVYRGKFNTDIPQSAKNYETLFDQSIQEGEKDSIQASLGSTNNLGEAKAGLIDKNQKTVKLIEKNVEVTTDFNNFLAKISVDEKYENTTDDVQEVYYEFSLPQNSVLTGLWLGNHLEYPAVVSPKGAARSTYENQIVRNTDPALLEQVGPLQYRLRVFPVPVNNQWAFPRQQPDQNSGKQRVKFEYITMKTGEGFMLPAISEQRNVYEDTQTKKTILMNGKAENNVDWNKNSIAVSTGNTTMNGCYKEALIAETSVGAITFMPYSLVPQLQKDFPCTEKDPKKIDEIKASKVPENLKIALLVDVSYSSKKIDWNKYVKENLPIALINQNTVDFYYFNEKVSQKITLNKQMLEKGLDPITAFGRTDRVAALENVSGDYDAVMMLTDGSDFEKNDKSHSAAQSQENLLSELPNAKPVYVIHADKEIPPYHDAFTKMVTQSRGAVFTDLRAAIEHLWLHKRIASTNLMPSENKIIALSDEGIWLTEEASAPLNADTQPISNTPATQKKFSSDPNYFFKKIASKKAIDYSILKGNIETNPEMLKKIHEVAKKESIVSPFSSMIALVDEWQKQQLAEAEKRDDAFTTTFDVGNEALQNQYPTSSGFLNLGSVPEPHEWALIILATLMIVYFYRREFLQFIKNRIEK